MVDTCTVYDRFRANHDKPFLGSLSGVTLMAHRKVDCRQKGLGEIFL